ncbi:Uu.00g091240.m01.CDS01 [Anthostomella pinea]|uniref:Uu.00g091240.m01.CDS01 n=1 Tax=Anthostomella pinea TaxID=933095 RepID=A0AAI8YKH2_9PEZI|nr:Uu.00g091240.m01.CDS01 [Anthostomella pinea]
MPSNGIRFCGMCSKPISTESAYKRHVSYCRRALSKPRKRKRSCKQCHSAKAKCSFEPECSRCRSKGLQCSYEDPIRPDVASAAELGTDWQNAAESTGDGESAMMIPDSPPATELVPFSGSFGAAKDIVLPATSPRLVTDLRADPVVQSSVELLLEAMRSLPCMMSSVHTSPWFIHGHWHAPELPTSVINCSGIARLYMEEKRPDYSGKASLRPFVDAENRRLSQALPDCSRAEAVAGIQVLLMYLIFCALENISVHGVPEVRLQLLMTLVRYCERSREIDNFEPFDIDKMHDPGQTWENWIYAETRRRCAVAWFIMSRVIDLKFGVLCPTIIGYRSIPLTSPGSLWTARTRGEWEALREIHRQEGGLPLRTFGELIDARAAPPDSDMGQRLNAWHASCDNLGLLLTQATALV